MIGGDLWWAIAGHEYILFHAFPCYSAGFLDIAEPCWAMLSQCRGTSCASAWRRRRPWRSHCRSRWLRNKTKTLRSSFEEWQSDKAWIWLTEDMEEMEYMKDLDSLGQIIIKWQVTKSIQESAFQVITWYHFPLFLCCKFSWIYGWRLSRGPPRTNAGSGKDQLGRSHERTRQKQRVDWWAVDPRQDMTRMIFSFYLRSNRTVQNQVGLIWISSQELLT